MSQSRNGVHFCYNCHSCNPSFPAASATLSHCSSPLLCHSCTSTWALRWASSPNITFLLYRPSSKLRYHHFLMKPCHITFLSQAFDVPSHKMKSPFTHGGIGFKSWLCSPAFSTLLARLFIGCCSLTLPSNYAMYIQVSFIPPSSIPFFLGLSAFSYNPLSLFLCISIVQCLSSYLTSPYLLSNWH